MEYAISASDLARQYAENPSIFDTGGGGGGAGFEIPFEWTAAYGGQLPMPFPTGGQEMSTGDIIGQIIQTGGQLAGQAISGGASGGVQTAGDPTFLARAYPVMLNQARSSNIAVDCFWFGQIIRVLPAGQSLGMGSFASLTDAEAWWTQQAANSQFYVMRCGGAGTALLTGCHFDLMGQGKPAAGGYTGSPGSVPVTTAGISSSNVGMIVLLGGAILLVYFFMGGKK